MVEAVAEAAEVPGEAVRRAFMLSGRLPATAEAALTGGAAASALKVITSLAISPLTTSRAFTISGKRRAMSATCPGWTNIPRILVVWSARPIQPLIRVLVRPVGHSPGSTADKSPVPKRISG